jgi:GNAT superfamily N-acetyltransferase
MIIENVDLNNKWLIEKIINLIYKTFCECNKINSPEKLIKKYETLYWENYNYEDTIQYLKDSSEIFIVSKDWDKVVWVIRGLKDKIINLYTDSQYQGKWIWKSLIEAFELEAKKLWSDYIFLKPSKYAYNFYINNGYSPKDDKYLEKFIK